MLVEVFVHLANDDKVSVSNIFEQYEGHNLGFVMNTDMEMKLDDGLSDEKESMFEWSLFQVALANKST